MVRLLFFMVCVAFVANGQPVWTQIMSTGGTTTDSSAEYFVSNASAGSTPELVSEATLLHHEPLNLPLNGSAIEEFGVDFTGECTNYDPASELYRSYLGPGEGTYKGLEALVTFNYKASDITGSSDYMGSSPDLEQTIFFGEQRCYNGGREYGIVLTGLTGDLDFYTLTNANEGGGYVAHDIAGTGWTGTQYWFVMWPESNGAGGCYFNTEILGPAPEYTVYRTSTISASAISGAGITSFDPDFCTAILNESGYVSVTNKVSPNVAFGSGAESSFTMNVAQVKIGK